MTDHVSNLPYCERHLIGKRYIRDGKEFECLGIMLGDNDWYYVMYPRSEGAVLSLLSCVGSIEGFGYEPVRRGRSREKQD